MKKFFINTWYIVLCPFVLFSACEKPSLIPDVDPAYCPSSIEIVLPEAAANLLYDDPASGTATLPMIVGEEVALQWRLQPDTATFQDVIWVSSNPQNVSVDDKGVIKALSATGLGYSVISVTPKGMYSASGVSYSLRVKVSATLVPATAISIESADGDSSIFIGNKLQLVPTISPAEATYRTVTWSSENPDIATVDNKGVVTGVSTHGQLSEYVNIIATAMDNSGVKASFPVRVKDVVDPTSVTLDTQWDKDHYACWVGDKSIALTYTTVPEESTFSKITWECTEPDIATVVDGVVYFNQQGNFGEFTIKATCPNGASDEIRMNLPVGLIRERFLNENNLTWGVAAQSGNGTETKQVWHEEGYLTCTTYNQNANTQRGDFQAKGKVWLNTANYPIFAIKMDYVIETYEAITSCAFKFDCVGKDKDGDTAFRGELGGGDKKWSKRYKCSDGSSVMIYDLREKSFPTGGLLPATTVAEFTTFQFKYADMKTSEAQIEYNVYWVETFKSIEAVQAAIEADGLTWEE
ncbi:MAG: DUF4979 domain-containing protein [Paludibacteraceae bacterium]|nr:DUF4979 domain-containing protein [Paludibacteraceae bacterium]